MVFKYSEVINTGSYMFIITKYVEWKFESCIRWDDFLPIKYFSICSYI